MSERRYTENDRLMAAVMLVMGSEHQSLKDVVAEVARINDAMPLASADPADPETAAGLAEQCEKLREERDAAQKQAAEYSGKFRAAAGVAEDLQHQLDAERSRAKDDAADLCAELETANKRLGESDSEVARLTGHIKRNSVHILKLMNDVETAVTERDAARREVVDLRARLEAAQADATTARALGGAR